jgi:hypothetical protein
MPVTINVMKIVWALLIDLFQHLFIILIEFFNERQRSFTLIKAAYTWRLKELGSSICSTGIEHLIIIISKLNVSPYVHRRLANFVRWLISLLKTFKTIKCIIAFLEAHNRSLLSNIVVAVNILCSSLQHKNIIHVFFGTWKPVDLLVAKAVDSWLEWLVLISWELTLHPNRSAIHLVALRIICFILF